MSACNPDKISMYIKTILIFNMFFITVFVVFTISIIYFNWDSLITRLGRCYKAKSYKKKKKNMKAENQNER